MDDSEIRAEALNQAETGGACSAYGGGHPKSIRKRGFHRALRRKEPWALYEQANREWFCRAAKALEKAVLAPNAFFGLLDRSDEPSPPNDVIAGFSAWLPVKP